jgi:hypothetical protein
VGLPAQEDVGETEGDGLPAADRSGETAVDRREAPSDVVGGGAGRGEVDRASGAPEPSPERDLGDGEPPVLDLVDGELIEADLEARLGEFEAPRGVREDAPVVDRFDVDGAGRLGGDGSPPEAEPVVEPPAQHGVVARGGGADAGVGRLVVQVVRGVCADLGVGVPGGVELALGGQGPVGVAHLAPVVGDGVGGVVGEDEDGVAAEVGQLLHAPEDLGEPVVDGVVGPAVAVVPVDNGELADDDVAAPRVVGVGDLVDEGVGVGTAVRVHADVVDAHLVLGGLAHEALDPGRRRGMTGDRGPEQREALDLETGPHRGGGGDLDVGLVFLVGLVEAHQGDGLAVALPKRVEGGSLAPVEAAPLHGPEVDVGREAVVGAPVVRPGDLEVVGEVGPAADALLRRVLELLEGPVLRARAGRGLDEAPRVAVLHGGQREPGRAVDEDRAGRAPTDVPALRGQAGVRGLENGGPVGERAVVGLEAEPRDTAADAVGVGAGVEQDLIVLRDHRAGAAQLHGAARARLHGQARAVEAEAPEDVAVLEGVRGGAEHHGGAEGPPLPAVGRERDEFADDASPGLDDEAEARGRDGSLELDGERTLGVVAERSPRHVDPGTGRVLEHLDPPALDRGVTRITAAVEMDGADLDGRGGGSDGWRVGLGRVLHVEGEPLVARGGAAVPVVIVVDEAVDGRAPGRAARGAAGGDDREPVLAGEVEVDAGADGQRLGEGREDGDLADRGGEVVDRDLELGGGDGRGQHQFDVGLGVVDDGAARDADERPPGRRVLQVEILHGPVLLAAGVDMDGTDLGGALEEEVEAVPSAVVGDPDVLGADLPVRGVLGRGVADGGGARDEAESPDVGVEDADAGGRRAGQCGEEHARGEAGGRVEPRGAVVLVHSDSPGLLERSPTFPSRTMSFNGSGVRSRPAHVPVAAVAEGLAAPADDHAGVAGLSPEAGVDREEVVAARGRPRRRPGCCWRCCRPR